MDVRRKSFLFPAEHPEAFNEAVLNFVATIKKAGATIVEPAFPFSENTLSLSDTYLLAQTE